jgi:hypothetical protein
MPLKPDLGMPSVRNPDFVRCHASGHGIEFASLVFNSILEVSGEDFQTNPRAI